MVSSDKALFRILDGVLASCARIDRQAAVWAQVLSQRSANLRFANGEITSCGDVTDTQITVAVARGRRRAHTTTNRTDAVSLQRSVEQAFQLAALSPEDPELMPPLPAQRYLAAPACHDPGTERLDAQARVRAVAPAIHMARERRLLLSGFYQHHTSSLAMCTSAGLRAHHLSTQVEYTTTARTAEGSGSGWAGAWSRRHAEIDALALSRRACETAQRSMRPRALPPGRYTVVMMPEAVAALLSFLCASLSARSADEGRSFFAGKGGGNRLGEKIFGEGITLSSDPTSEATSGAPFDHEGLPLAPLMWVDRGALLALSYSRFWAERQGRKPTGAHEVFQLHGGSEPPEELIRQVKRGVLISRLWYIRWVDPQTLLVTGLTRDGVFLIEDGQVTVPVNNFRFNDSPVSLLRNADGLSAATERAPFANGNLRVPWVRSHDFHLTSISEAI